MPFPADVVAGFRVASEPVITYVRVERPQLDIVRVVLAAFSLTGMLVLLALALGIALGVALIRRRRRERPYHPGLDLGSPPSE